MNQLHLQIERLVPIRWLGVGLLFLGLFIGTFLAVADDQGAPRRLGRQYIVYLERRLRLLFIWTPGYQIAAAQAAAVVAVLLLCALVGIPHAYLWILFIAAAPAVYIERLRRRRVGAIEAQLDGFLVALANALKATPSLLEAFASVERLVAPPLRDEIALAVKETRVGSTLDQALLFMSARIGSRQVDSALAAVLIGRKIGGNLPKILDTTSSTLREMARLEGVVRTKTAEGKMQLWVLALFPLLLMIMFDAVKPDYFAPLTQSVVGYLVVVVAVIFWIASLVAARKILNVDL
ncbi:type II secretion system F family protein [Sorangium sp. So ce1128]